MRNKLLILALFCTLLWLSACTPAGNENPGSEYFPDMAHSIAYEANYYDYYYHNTWGTEDDYYKMAQPRLPVKGTIPRGYAGVVEGASFADRDAAMAKLSGASSPNALSIPVNGSVPYYYGDTEEERTRATAEIIDNPFPITEAGLAVGKELYDINCGICHGAKGDGNGYLVAEDNPNVAYPAQPANMLTDDFISSSNGRYYHAIIYGKNVMGGYKDKLSYEERWQVIHHIRALQAKEKKLAYNENENTLNDIEVPGATLPSKPVMAEEMTAADDEYHEEDAHHDGGGEHQSDDAGHGEHH